jgi:hypothetical protein
MNRKLQGISVEYHPFAHEAYCRQRRDFWYYLLTFLKAPYPQRRSHRSLHTSAEFKGACWENIINHDAEFVFAILLAVCNAL